MKVHNFHFLAACLCLANASLAAADEAVSPSPRGRGQGEGRPAGVPPAYPLWDGHETVAQYARRVNQPETQTLDLGNGVSLDLVLIPAGKFIMGTPEPKPVDEEGFLEKVFVGVALLAVGGAILLVLIGFAILLAIREKRRFQYSLRRFMAMMLAASLCVLGGMHWWHSQRTLQEARAEYNAAMARFKDANDDEKPAHLVTITKPFYMGKYEVTQEQFKQVMGANPSSSKGPKLPVEQASWEDAKEFCKKASSVQQSSGLLQPQSGGLRHKVRLPTSAEWEYACRAGTTTSYNSGDKEADLARAAWYWRNSGHCTHPVGQKEPNAWGLYDMHGNVWVWCVDWFGFCPKAALTDPQRPANGDEPVLRGGGWWDEATGCRSAGRIKCPPDYLRSYFGFRVVLAGPP